MTRYERKTKRWQRGIKGSQIRSLEKYLRFDPLMYRSTAHAILVLQRQFQDLGSAFQVHTRLRTRHFYVMVTNEICPHQQERGKHSRQHFKIKISCPTKYLGKKKLEPILHELLTSKRKWMGIKITPQGLLSFKELKRKIKQKGENREQTQAIEL